MGSTGRPDCVNAPQTTDAMGPGCPGLAYRVDLRLFFSFRGSEPKLHLLTRCLLLGWRVRGLCLWQPILQLLHPDRVHGMVSQEFWN